MEFNPECVALTADGHASVTLEAEVSRGGAAERMGRWQVGLLYDKRMQVWTPEVTVAPEPKGPPGPSVDPSEGDIPKDTPVPSGS